MNNLAPGDKLRIIKFKDCLTSFDGFYIGQIVDFKEYHPSQQFRENWIKINDNGRFWHPIECFKKARKITFHKSLLGFSKWP